MTTEATVLWEPPADVLETTRAGAFLRAVEARHGVSFDGSYEALWRWSVDHLEDFWQLVVDELGISFHDAPSAVLGDPAMPGATWFPGATLNYAEHALRMADDAVAIVHTSQTRAGGELTAGELRDAVARCRAGLARLGVGRGDRVAAFLPNIPETVVAFLATASLGAVWSSCAPEFGTQAVVDRWQQIEPTVLLTVDGYRYGSKDVDRRAEIAAIREALPTLSATVLLPYLDPDATLDGAVAWAELLAEPGELAFTPVPFDHPLYVLFSSGTTGIPKAIVHGHGGILVEHAKMLALHHELGPSDRFFWFSTTGWMMWNYLVSGLVVGSTIVLFDGDPGSPDLLALWRMAAETHTTYVGVSAPFLLSCRKAGVDPAGELDLSAVRGVGSTGAPLPPEGFVWVYEHVGRDLVLASASGGTDVCTAFVGASALVPVRAGEIPCRALGARVEAFDPDGRSVVDQRGELVITAPMPSMPVGFWGDEDGSRYRAAYFEDFPGVWRHGDWIRITEDGACVITGRSDATLNRGGVRMGTAEFYRAVEDLEEVRDSLVVHLEDPTGDTPGELLLFVALAAGVELDDDLRRRVAGTIRERLSPRHVPDALHAVADVPRTLSGKKLEVPVKRLLGGERLEDVASEGALANPASLEDYRRVAAARAGG